MASWRTRVRIVANQFLLNPLFATFYDWVAPASSLGHRGERIAERHLLKKGMYVVDRGYRESYGEIDLVAIDNRTVVFVEVKTRSSDFAGTPVEAVDEEKQRKISRVATSFVKRHGLHEIPCRFDVVAIELSGTSAKPKLQYFEHAFEAAE